MIPCQQLRQLLNECPNDEHAAQHVQLRYFDIERGAGRLPGYTLQQHSRTQMSGDVDPQPDVQPQQRFSSSQDWHFCENIL